MLRNSKNILCLAHKFSIINYKENKNKKEENKLKKFITAIPLQPPKDLKISEYEAVDNKRFVYGKTSFPIIPLIAGYTEKGENIEVIAIQNDYPYVKENFKTFKNELKQLSINRGFSYVLDEDFIIPYDDSQSVLLEKCFKVLIKKIKDGDRVGACITYGSKPLSYIIQMAVNFACRARNNCRCEALVYGGFDFIELKAKIYDQTNLYNVDELVNTEGLLSVDGDDITRLLDRIL